MTIKLSENSQIVSAFVPVNMATAANDGDWVSLRGFNKLLILLFKGIGTAGEDPVFTLRQATDVAGAGAKALDFTVIRSKVGATALNAIGVFTETTQTAANTFTDIASAENEAMILVEVLAEDLDVSGDFDCVQLQIPDVGTGAQIGCGLYILTEPRYPQDLPESSIVD